MPPLLPLDTDRLTADFAGLGLKPTCRMMVHASLSALGPVAGGAATVVAALHRSAGEDGAVIIPSFRDAIRSDHFALRECEAGCPQPLCPSRERGFTGAIGEAVREQKNAVRSCHPTHSWVGVGGDAAFLLGGHHRSLTPCGTDSPFLRLLERNGKLLLLGVGVRTVTNIHVVEDARNVPYLSAIEPRRRHATYTTSGRRIQYLYPQLLDAALREAGLLRSGRVGASTSHVIDARDLGSFLWVATENDPWCLVVRPRGTTYDPFEDACLKTAAMTRAWRQKGDRSAWRLLVAASRNPRDPVLYEPTKEPRTNCPAYAGVIGGRHRCHANDLGPDEKVEDHPQGAPGVATCGQCGWSGNEA